MDSRFRGNDVTFNGALMGPQPTQGDENPSPRRTPKAPIQRGQMTRQPESQLSILICEICEICGPH